jgi:DNA repair protein RecO
LSEHEDDAVILRVLDFRERDRIVHLLTRTRGQKSGVLFGAKSPRSPYRALAEPFTQVRLHYSERASAEMIKIRQVDPIEIPVSLRRDYGRLLHASYLCELAWMSPVPESDAPELYAWLGQYLEALSDGSPPETLRWQAEWMLLEQLGVLPQWQECVECGTPVPTNVPGSAEVPIPEILHQVDAQAGGVRCPQCVLRHPGACFVSPGTVRLLQHNHSPLRAEEFPESLTRLQHRELLRVLQVLLRSNLGREPKSAPLLPRPK